MNKLNPSEVFIIHMALQSLIDDTESVCKNARIPFTPEARKDMKDILDNAKSALKKITVVSGSTIRMDPYKEGDEAEFLTKQS